MIVSSIVERLADVSAASWDALHDGRNPFVAHAFLSGLEQHGCLRPDWGWTPHHIALWEDNVLIAAAPGYLKANSHGEFVFDHAWAHAYARYGQEYFPKWLFAVPYTPVSGPRLLARGTAARDALLAAIVAHARTVALPSAHINFYEDGENAAFDEAWLPRIDVQYHWRNEAKWTDFDAFLAAMDHKHRKNIRQERAKVALAGVSFRTLPGNEATADDLATMHALYLQTFAEYGNSPALTLAFLQHLARTMPDRLVLLLAERGGRTIAGALCLRSDDTLYGRYWGAFETVPGLHFETCYYQGIEYCLRERLRVFEPGAQGEHKIARGFLPTLVRSRHWIADPVFAEALTRWCDEEAVSVRRYKDMLMTHAPFRSTQGET